MFRTVCNYTIPKSPCKSCVVHTERQAAVIESCNTFCWPLNAYLVKIGEPPHVPPSKIPLHVLYPPEPVRDLVTKEETLLAAEHVKYLQTKYPLASIGRMTGLDPSYLKQLGSRIKRMERGRFERVMEL